MSSIFTYEEVKTFLDAKTVGFRSDNIEKVVIDSREAASGTLFVPLVGEVTDGNLYIESALKLGCRSSLVSTAYFDRESDLINSYSHKYGCTFFIVDDGLLALHKLATFYIGRFKGLKIVAITGSSGKTTTKEVLGSILKADRPTLVTEGNYNSETGLPLTVFRIGSEHDFAVLEIGMSRPGEIKALVDIINPYISIITNIGSAHIGFFGSRDGIAKEKKSAFANFSGENIAVIPNWDDYYNYLKSDVNGRVLSVYDNPDYISDIRDLGFDGWSFLYEGQQVHYPYMGRYNLLNAFVAISCARELGLHSSAIVKGLENLPSMFGRGEVLSGKNRVIRDCYNANPDSTLSSLQLLGSTEWEGDKIPIIGSMLELGDSSYEEHKKVANFAVSNFSKVILFGEEFEKVHDLFRGSLGTLFCKDMDVLREVVADNIEPNSLVLLKASRGVKLEDITKSLL